jgi:hypothetical protein
VYPRAAAEQLAAAREALEKNDEQKTAEQPLPQYLQRLSHPLYRIIMFICGCGLVLIAFICFGPMQKTDGLHFG